MGFVKAFGYAEVKQLTITISKPSGLFWLSACVLFLLAAILLFFKADYWWLIAFVAIAISQVLIFTAWHDAKFGTIANVLLLIAVLLAFSAQRYYNTYTSDVKTNLLQLAYFGNEDLTEADLTPLPEPVKNYLRYTGCLGKPKVNNFKIKFKGKIRKNEQSEWMPFTSEQYNFMHTPTRLFFMKAVMKKLPVAGYHCFVNGSAFMDIRLFSLIKVQYKDGAEMNMAETVTFFNDMCCLAPATLIDKRIKWLDADSNSVKASFTNNGITINATLYFNKEGALINFISNDRYDHDAGKKLPWKTPLSNYSTINGQLFPQHADAIYQYPEGDLCYGMFETTSVEYNCGTITK